MSKTAFAIGCHPDDIEFMMAGTLVKLRDAGYEIHYMNVANGSCGTNRLDRDSIVAIRRDEAMRAAELVGATYHESLVNDIEVFYERETLFTLGAIIREVAPEIILTHYPFEYMEDHSNTCRLVVSAAFCRGMTNFSTVPETPPIDGATTIYHTVPYGLHDPLRRLINADLYVDVKDQIDVKTEMLAAHVSQKEWLDVSQGMDSYLISMRDQCAKMGEMSGEFEFAEGWIPHSHQGFCGPEDDPLSEALGDAVVAGRG